MEWLPDTACTETLEPRRQELREAAEQNSPEEPSLHGEGATDSRDEFGAEKATQRSPGDSQAYPQETAAQEGIQALSQREGVQAGKMWVSHNIMGSPAGGCGCK